MTRFRELVARERQNSLSPLVIEASNRVARASART